MRRVTPLFPAEPCPPRDRRANIIVIPAYGAPPPTNWRTDSAPWLQLLVTKHESKAQTWTFDYDLKANGSPYLEQLQQSGHDLVESLKVFCASVDARKPLMFIAYSIGGLVLKTALRVLYDQGLACLDVSNVISGICFISTPQLPPRYEIDPNILSSMIRATIKEAPPRSAFSGDENDQIEALCHDFKNCRYSVPILTVCEAVDTKISLKGIMTKIRRARLRIVPKEISAIGAEKEHDPIEVSRPHDETCNISPTEKAFVEISQCLQQIITDAPAMIATQYRGGIPTGLEGTIGSHSERGLQSAPISVSGRVTTHDSGYGTSELPSPRRTATSMTQVPAQASESSRTVTIFESSKRDPRLPFRSALPNLPKVSCGREEILALMDKKLIPDTERKEASTDAMCKRIRSFSIRGMGGIGKSWLANQYAHSRQNKFEAIFWIKADERDSLPLEYARIAAELGLVDSVDDQDLQSAVQTFRNWLSHPVRTYSVTHVARAQGFVKWLLIFDNVEDFDALIDFLPTSGTGSVLLTTRDLLTKLKTPTINSDINLNPFSEEESIELIQLLTKKNAPRGQEEALSEIATILGGLPLLITSMAGVMRRLTLTYSDFLRLYKSSGLEQTSSYGNTYDIFAKFGFEKLDSSALGMLQILAFLNPDCIQESILNVEGSDEIYGIDFPLGSAKYFTARKHLLQSSLIYLNVNDEDSYIELHRMVQHITRQKLGKQGEVKYLNAAISLVSKVWPFRNLEDRFNTSRYDEYDKYINHVFSLRNAYEQLSSTGSDLLPPSIPAARLFNDAGWYWFERGYPQEAKPFFRLTQSICEASDERSSEEVSYMLREAHNNQGSAAAETNDKEECLHHNKQWLRMTLLRRTSNVAGVIDYELGIVHNEIGVAYAMNDQYDEAILNFLSCINIFTSLPDREDRWLGWPMPNLGFMFWVLAEYEEAEKTLKKVLEIHEAAYGVDDTQSFKTGKIFYALGNVYTSMGKHDTGYEYHKRCLIQYQATLGTDNHRVADTYHRLADHCTRLSNYDEARHYISRALEIFSSRPYYQNELARSTYKEAEILKAMGLNDDAEERVRKAFQLRQAIYPHDERTIDELNGDDYDKMVIFWSR